MEDHFRGLYTPNMFPYDPENDIFENLAMAQNILMEWLTALGFFVTPGPLWGH